MLLTYFLFFLSLFSFFDCVVFFLSIPLLFLFSLCCRGFLFDGIFFSDYFSVLLVFVTIWVFSLSMITIDLSYLGFRCFWFMLVLLCCSFLTFSYLLFYVFFELVFLIMFYFLLGWGKTSERLQASFYIFFFTMVFSLPFLVMLVDRRFSGCEVFNMLGVFYYSDYF